MAGGPRLQWSFSVRIVTFYFELRFLILSELNLKFNLAPDLDETELRCTRGADHQDTKTRKRNEADCLEESSEPRKAAMGSQIWCILLMFSLQELHIDSLLS